MAQVVYVLASGYPGESVNVVYFADKELVDYLLETEGYFNMFGLNDGCVADTLTFPDDLDLRSCGIYLSDKFFKKGD